MSKTVYTFNSVFVGPENRLSVAIWDDVQRYGDVGFMILDKRQDADLDIVISNEDARRIRDLLNERFPDHE